MNNHEETPNRPVIVAGEQTPRNRREDSNASVTSMVLGSFSLLFYWVFYISFFMALIGLILGIVSLAEQRKGHKMAVVGVITSAIGIPLSFIEGLGWFFMLLGVA